jgi:hypothetical protein
MAALITVIIIICPLMELRFFLMVSQKVIGVRMNWKTTKKTLAMIKNAIFKRCNTESGFPQRND